MSDCWYLYEEFEDYYHNLDLESEQGIQKAFESIESQTCENIEHIINDEFSIAFISNENS